MRGTSHAVVGLAAGGALAYAGDYSSTETMFIIGTAVISALAPDLDTNGKLTNRLIISPHLIQGIFAMIGIAILAASYFQLLGIEKWLGYAIGAALVILPTIFITPKVMLIGSGVGILTTGVYLMEIWIISFGVFVTIAAFLPHRGLTHSIWGLLFFSWIAFGFQNYAGVEGVWVAGTLGYLSHLITDMKFMPLNRRGVKWFQPFINKEI